MSSGQARRHTPSACSGASSIASIDAAWSIVGRHPDCSWSAAAAVRTGEYFEQVAVRILEIDAATTIAGIDPVRLALHRIGPVGDLAFLDPGKNLVELVLADQESVVLGSDAALGVDEVECDLVFCVHGQEWSERHRSREAKDLRQEGCRGALVACRYNRVVELDGHGCESP